MLFCATCDGRRNEYPFIRSVGWYEVRERCPRRSLSPEKKSNAKITRPGKKRTPEVFPPHLNIITWRVTSRGRPWKSARGGREKSLNVRPWPPRGCFLAGNFAAGEWVSQPIRFGPTAGVALVGVTSGILISRKSDTHRQCMCPAPFGTVNVIF